MTIHTDDKRYVRVVPDSETQNQSNADQVKRLFFHYVTSKPQRVLAVSVCVLYVMLKDFIFAAVCFA